MGNIQEFNAKIKNVVDDLLTERGLIAVVFLVALASFALGRLSALETARPAVSIRQAALAAEARPMAPGGLVVASRTGTSYHYPWCSGADSIKSANQVWFQNEQDARAAGYTPAKNCKGLE